ncbi:hypothetical protein EW026_g7864 [Hermanssonia centrifuga]|uniref:Uncharacterized protein n=1 Tax=Hermanssonia centrifuga TaxID=98765 RepID=A0A4S4K6E4_9APHY|nr:hypothetical protein EW026_g7864 [Hermanssonia centrifuga]
MSAKYTINVLIDPAQVEILRKGGFKLCLAKDTNHDVDVIWQAAE